MLKNLGIILLCMTFIFATSGNSRGLIFKNMAKTSFELKEKIDFGAPAAEEVFEQVTEKKPPTSVFYFPIVFQEVYNLDHSNFFIKRVLIIYVNDIPVPPPKY